MVEHICKDRRGKAVRRKAPSNTLCTMCNTQIVYVHPGSPVKE